jgi:glycosyltransferase involved in cell wall biosynthesis
VPQLSIIIPTFNSAMTIERCLVSIGNQTFTDFEIVVQDGLSKDNTLDIVREFQRATNRIEAQIESNKDYGIYDAMNRAMARANGEWLYFLGSDDELHDANVLKAVMSREHVGNNDVLYGNVRIIGEWEWATDGSLYDGPFDLPKLLTRNISHQAIFYRAELARRVGSFNVNYPICADWDFNLRCWAVTKFKYIDVAVAKFYAGGLSSSGHSDDRFSREVAANVMRYFAFSLLNPLVNAPNFVGFYGTIRMQRAKGALPAFSGRVLRRILKLQKQVRAG